jgi:hypothetical protein
MLETVRAATPAWIHDLAFIAAIALPEDWAREFGTTVNGMWADPDRWTPDRVEAAHAEGRRILVSVPLIALTHEVYEAPDTAYLMDEVCRDIRGNPAEVEWYYWDAKPVYSLCVHSPVLRRYLVDRLRPAIAAGVDVVNVDEINTSVGLMTREPKGSGFCARCLDESAVVARARDDRGTGASADTVRAWLRDDDVLFAKFAEEQQRRAFEDAGALLTALRDLASSDGRDMAITANVAGLGAFVGNHGPLWSAMWGELLDLIMLEAIYVVAQSQFEDPHAHKLLPRGTFAPLYRLGGAIGPKAPIWIAPQINVPRQLAGQRRERYYELMFLEAYANGGRWGYNWWPGVDDATRRAATAPDALKEWTSFLRRHRDLLVGLTTDNEVAVVYSNAAVLRDPETHYRYLGLAQALYEGGVQFDVIYTGDDRFALASLDSAVLARYETVIVPGRGLLEERQAAAIEQYQRDGGTVISIDSDSSAANSIARFWAGYADADRDAVLASVPPPDRAVIRTSTPRVVGTKYLTSDGRVVVHLLNYDYHEDTDEIEPARNVEVSMGWPRDTATISLTTREGTAALSGIPSRGRVVFRVPILADYAIVTIE